MKRLFSKLFKRKIRTKVYRINYSVGKYRRVIGSARWIIHGIILDDANNLIGQFEYHPRKNFGVVIPSSYSDKYFIPKSLNSDWQAPDTYIDPEFGRLMNAHSLREFLKKEFAI